MRVPSPRHWLLRRHLSTYADGAVAPGLRARLEEHLDRCARCRSELEELRAASRALSLMPQELPPRSFLLRLDQVAGVGRPLPPPVALRGLQVAAVAFSLLLAALVAWDVVGPAATPGPSATAPTFQERALAVPSPELGSGIDRATLPTPTSTPQSLREAPAQGGVLQPPPTDAPPVDRRPTSAERETGRGPHPLRLAQVAAATAVVLALGGWLFLALRWRRTV